ncbi:MAG: septal ring lytic transglycosylase RlpA family protein [Pseudomonadales bacterium]|nr:septal ring lytic transglycosylase RlpA family protein [Pseudomonadales bacterium]
MSLGCSTSSMDPQQSIVSGTRIDGAPNVPINLDKIKSPTPKSEPLSRYGNHSPYTVLGKTYQVWETGQHYQEDGVASWYGTKFHGQHTSSWEPYDMLSMTAAHKHLPLPSFVRVTNLENKKTIIVRVNDRGPFHNERIIDLSYAAALKLDMTKKGTARVSIETLATPYDKLTPTRNRDAIYVQAGAFANVLTAQQLKFNLTDYTDTPIRIVNKQHKKTGMQPTTLFKIQIGPFTSVKKAQLLTQRIRDNQLAQAFILTKPAEKFSSEANQF